MSFQISQPVLDYTAPVVLLVGGALLFAERKWALRRWIQGFWRHTLRNGLAGLPALLFMRLALIPLIVGTAHGASEHDFGFLRWFLFPPWAAAIIGFLLLDYLLYAWHRLSHGVPFIWRFHNVHHTDLDLGVTTAVRFHFGEMFLTALFRSTGVALIGVSPIVVLAYEVAFELSVAFHHSNWRLPLRLERFLNIFIVTPRMHGIHHSIVRRETDSNYSNMFNLWDRIHGTLRLNIPQHEITVGVPAYRDDRDQSVIDLLMMPFRKQRDYWRLPDGAQPDRSYTSEDNRLPPDKEPS